MDGQRPSVVCYRNAHCTVLITASAVVAPEDEVLHEADRRIDVAVVFKAGGGIAEVLGGSVGTTMSEWQLPEVTLWR